MPLSIADLFSTASEASFSAVIESTLIGLGINPATWPTDGIGKKWIAAVAKALGVPAGTSAIASLSSGLDGLVTGICKGGFLDTAADVTDQTTPGAYGFLDALAASLADESRSAALKAAGPVTLTNTGAVRGPFAAGTYHLNAPSGTNRSFSNVAELTLGVGDTTAGFQADVAGAASVVANTLTPVTSLIGVSVKVGGGANLNTLLGLDAQTNLDLIDACRGRLQSLGPRLGPAGACVYFAKASKLAGYPTLTSAINRVAVVMDKYTGWTTLYFASLAGPLSGPDTTAIGTYLASVMAPSAMNFAYSAAITRYVGIALTVYVPAAYSAVAAPAVEAAIILYLQTLPLGGTDANPVGLQRAALEAFIMEQVTYIENITSTTFDGAAADLALGVGELPDATGPLPTIVVVTT